MGTPWFKFLQRITFTSPFVQALDSKQDLCYLRLILASIIG